LLPDGAYHPHELADVSTIKSFLDDTRIRIEPGLLPKPHLTFNFYARSLLTISQRERMLISSAAGGAIKAKNGYIYLLEAPLLPPLPPLGGLFVVPSVFSTLTSGVQKVGLDLHTFKHKESEATDDVHPAVYEMLQEIVSELPPSRLFTVFAPTNGVSTATR
jgi:hypothetical protein